MELDVLDESDPQPSAQKPPVPESALLHRQLLRGDFWRRVPAYRDVSEAEFLDHRWQSQRSITSVKKLLAALQDLVPASFIEDARLGFHDAPMSVRVSPYLLSLIDWDDPIADPLRRQFIPLASRMLPDHPRIGLDSLAERADAPVPGLTHRYPDKVLFLPLDTCPVYCRFCTRSYAVGRDTDAVEKFDLHVDEKRWRRAFAYIASRPEVEDVVVSGGDMYNLRASQITLICEALLGIPHVRRIRLATKGPAVMPQKILTDHVWRDAIIEVVDRGRKLRKEVVIHTHFNHPNEITGITQDAMNLLFERGVTVRNQSVLQRGVNDSVDTMRTLCRRLGYLNVHPYYVYQHDLVKGLADLRTPLRSTLAVEKGLRGTTAGFNTPTFVVDAPGGGGKRDAHSYEHYNRGTGISVYTAPSVKAGAFLYFDPLDTLPDEGKARWKDPREHDVMIDEALCAAAAVAVASR